MQEFKIILLAITCIGLWHNKGWEILTKEVGVYRDYRNRVFRYLGTHKPFNCSTCLTVWIGIILCISFDYNIIYLSLPLLYKLTSKLWN